MEKKKALVIDDEQVVLDSVKKILDAENYDVDLSLEGKKGIDLAIRNSYDIVLTDIRMPDIGGLIVLRDIKRSKPSLPVMIITGFGSVRSAVQAMKLGAADYIEKPFDPDQLVQAISRAIETARTQEPEPQEIIHKEEVIKVLELTETDNNFRKDLLYYGSDALNEFNLTGPEKLAIITGDIQWIDKQIGPLTAGQKQWLEARLSAEIW
ncbi:MAG: response regulator [Desulfobacula sp.]|jgi:DNA-binding NtrC family response regulator